VKFEPIAIVGQGCVLPGGLNPDALWKTVHEGRDVLGSAEPGYWVYRRHTSSETKRMHPTSTTRGRSRRTRARL